MTAQSMRVIQLLCLIMVAAADLQIDPRCCKAESEFLQDCFADMSAQRFVRGDGQDEKTITLVSYATPSIMSYASYSFAIMGAYADRHGYGLSLHSPKTGSEYEKRDQRWNRVKILSTLVESLPLLKPAYFVWFDADVIFLDFDMRIEDLIEAHPDKDLIISAERHAETGVANTGCFIVKNSLWTRDFLREWWHSFDRSLAHDQIFFSKLYRSLSPETRDSHIAVLPTNVLNSTPPPMLYQQPTDRVLHLMGESSDVRVTAFSLAWTNLCKWLTRERGGSGVHRQPSQLGLTQPVLLSLAQHSWTRDLDDVLHQLSKSAASATAAWNAAVLANQGGAVGKDGEWQVRFSLVARARETLLQLAKHDFDFEVSGAGNHNHNHGVDAVQEGDKEEEEDEGEDVKLSSDRNNIKKNKSTSSSRIQQLSDLFKIVVPEVYMAGERGGRKVEALNLCGVVGQDLSQALVRKLELEEAEEEQKAQTDPPEPLPVGTRPDLMPREIQELRKKMRQDKRDAQKPERDAIIFSIRSANDQVEQCLHDLIVSVKPESRHLVLEMMALQALSRGNFELQLGGSRWAALSSLRRAVRYLGSIGAETGAVEGAEAGAGAGAGTGKEGGKEGEKEGQAATSKINPHHAVTVLQGLAHALCFSTPSDGRLKESDVSEGLAVYKRALRLQDGLLAADSQWKQDHIQLAGLLVEGGLCALSLRNIAQARVWLSRVEKIAAEHPQRHELHRSFGGGLSLLRERVEAKEEL